MADVSGANFVRTNETQGSHHTARANDPRDLFLNAEPILHHEHYAGIVDHRWQEFRQPVVLRRFQAHANDVALRHVADSAVSIHAWQGEVAVLRFADET